MLIENGKKADANANVLMKWIKIASSYQKLIQFVTLWQRAWKDQFQQISCQQKETGT